MGSLTQEKTRGGPKQRGRKRVLFTLEAPGANVVSVAGAFNGWDTGKGAMRMKRGGRWERIVYLEPGEHEYKFMVDGEWMADPVSEEKKHNSFGTLNSVMYVG